jgi:hypothetical protein
MSDDIEISLSEEDVKIQMPNRPCPFDVSLTVYPMQPWTQKNANLSQWFNYGLNPSTWSNYCLKQIEHMKKAAGQ